MSAKLKLGIVSTAMDGRQGMGTAIYTEKLIEYLLKYYQNEFDIFLIHYQQPTGLRLPIYDQVKEVIIPYYQLPVASHAFSESLFFLTKRLNLDIVHYPRQRVYPGFVFSHSTKRIVTIHDAGTWRLASKAPLANYFYNRTLKWFRSKIDGVITVSEAAKKDIQKYYKFPLEKIHVQYPGVNEIFKKIDINQPDAANFKNKYGIKNKFILDVSRLQPHKNIKNLILAFKKIEQQNIGDQQLVIVGEHSYETEQIKSLIKELNLQERVLLPGYVPDSDLLYFYNLAEMLAFPSLHEGFGFPVVEAMACGCPVITSNSTSLPEIGGDAAILINPRNPEEIFQAMAKLLTDFRPKQELIKNGLERSQYFSWNKSIEKLVDYYEQIYYGNE